MPQHQQDESIGGDARTGCNLLLAGADALSFHLKACRQGRGRRCDSALARGVAIVCFPFIVVALGRSDPGVIYAAWAFHVGMILVMAVNRRALQRRHGPTHSRFVGWSLPECLGAPAGLAKLALEPAMWVAVGIGLCELGQPGLGNFYCIGALCLLPEWLIIVQRDDTLTTDAVDARLEAEERAGQVRSKLGG